MVVLMVLMMVVMMAVMMAPQKDQLMVGMMVA